MKCFRPASLSLAMRLTLGALSCAIYVALGTTMAAAQTRAPSPHATATPNPFAYTGYVRSYYFTRQNASNGVHLANQASWNTALNLHGSYNFANSGFSLGATYLYANPLNQCGSPLSHLSPPCGKLAPPALNPDDTLPGFDLSTLYEAYAQYKGGGTFARLGDQVINTPFANGSDGRLKPAAFQGGYLSYKFSPRWTGAAAYMTRFEGRVNSAFENSTLLTSHPADAPGVPSNIYTPGGGPITTNGFGYARLGYAGNGLSANVYYYAMANIANLLWLDGKYTWKKVALKPYLAVQFGDEANAGSAVLGKIAATAAGVQAGVSLARGLGFSVGYDEVPVRNDTVVLPAGVACGANAQIAVRPGTTFGYFLPAAGTPNCAKNTNGTTTIYYGGFASPYTDSYVSDPFFTTSMTQGMVDRHSPGSSVKMTLAFSSGDQRFKGSVSRALYEYGDSASGTSPTQETDVDAFWYFGRVGKGAYRGLLLHERYAVRTQSNTRAYGGLPLFEYTRTQVEYDF